MRAWSWWVGLWSRREAPTTLAVLRLSLGSLLLVDLLMTAQRGLVVPLYAPLHAGGLGDVLARHPVQELYRFLPATAATAELAFWTCTAAVACFTLGIFPRVAGLLALLLLAQLALPVPPADRGIDMLLRDALLVLALSRSGESLGLGARLRTGSWLGDGRPVPSWPRYLLVVQLVLLYASAGIQKVSLAWLPPRWSALYIAAHDPAFGRWDAVAWPAAAWHLSQAGTALSWLWEWSAPLLLLGFWYRDTADRPGRLRAFVLRWHLLGIYVGVGALFHLGTHLAMRLGIFPFGVLSLYPCFVHPETFAALGRRVRGPLRRPLHRPGEGASPVI